MWPCLYLLMMILLTGPWQDLCQSAVFSGLGGQWEDPQDKECRGPSQRGWSVNTLSNSWLYIWTNATNNIVILFCFCPFRPCYQWANLRLGELQSLKLDYLSFNTTLFGEIQEGAKPFKCRRAKITQGKNNPIYSISTKLPFYRSYKYKNVMFWW